MKQRTVSMMAFILGVNRLAHNKMYHKQSRNSAKQCVCVASPCLLAAGVEGLLQSLAGLGHVALLDGGEVVWVLQCDL